jgi:hypothetical protein
MYTPHANVIDVGAIDHFRYGNRFVGIGYL